MKKKIVLYLLSMICLSMIIVPNSSIAIPIINNISFNPSNNLWIGEGLTIYVNCTDNETYEITKVKSQIVSNDGYIIPNKTFEHRGNGIYEIFIEPLYMNEPAIFTVNISCTNNISVQTLETSSFEISNFSVDTISDTPISAYVGDQIEINLDVTRNGAPITSGVEFDIKIDGDEVEPKVDPPYNPAKGWIIYIDSPVESGTYDLEIFASYGRANGTVITELTVGEEIQFYIKDVDKGLVEPGDEIKIDLKAFDRGEIIALNSENVEIKIESSKAEIKSITPVSNYFRITVEAPSLSAGERMLKASLKYGNYTYTDSQNIHYAVSISGIFVNEKGKGIFAQIVFYSDNVEELRLNAKTDGGYFGVIKPGTYDVKFVFSESKLELEDVEVSSFEDPLNYYYTRSSDAVPELNLAGLYVFETTLPFSTAEIEMEYNEDKVYDENSLKVYRCSNWNDGKKLCYGSWKEVGVSIDTVRNLVILESSSLSAYAIGAEKRLSVDYNLDKQKYYSKDIIKIRGLTLDKNRNIVDNVSVRGYIDDTTIEKTVFSDRNGIFSIELISPEEEGNYSLHLFLEKNNYLDFSSKKKIEIVKSREISIGFPDTIKIKQGEISDKEITISNTGQADIYNLELSLMGIAEEYYNLTQNAIEELKSGGKKKILIKFSIPTNASLGTFSAKINVTNEKIGKEKIFGFTVLEKNETEASAPSTGLITWPKISLPEMGSTLIYLLVLVFAIASFSIAIFLKKRKNEYSGKEKDEVGKEGYKTGIKLNVLDLKRLIKRRKSTKKPVESKSSEDKPVNDYNHRFESNRFESTESKTPTPQKEPSESHLLPSSESHENSLSESHSWPSSESKSWARISKDIRKEQTYTRPEQPRPKEIIEEDTELAWERLKRKWLNGSSRRRNSEFGG